MNYSHKNISYIVVKSGTLRKGYWFSEEFIIRYPKFTEHFKKYYDRLYKVLKDEDILFKNEYNILDYLEQNKIPCRIYSCFYNKEFENSKEVRRYLDNTVKSRTMVEEDCNENGNVSLFCNNYIKILPDNLKVKGYLDLSYSQIIALPNNLRVDGDLYLRGTEITSLPDCLKVGGELVHDILKLQPHHKL
ncbi:MAG: hypothetical protein FWG63_01820 [Defluviitaleaceae bacterium]|nr:hypothetical protein [Defluviitaleaceae bacterium]